MSFAVFFSSLLLLMLYTNQTQADPIAPLEDSATLDISGAIVDRTITFSGREFHRYFADFWSYTYPNEQAIITIIERPSARWGNQIWIEYKSQKLIETRISSRSNLKTIAEQLAENCHQKVLNIRVAEQFTDTFDLEKDEI